MSILLCALRGLGILLLMTVISPFVFVAIVWVLGGGLSLGIIVITEASYAGHTIVGIGIVVLWILTIGFLISEDV